MTDADFVTALEHWDEFLEAEIIEYKNGSYAYPVGVGWGGLLIHFMHYDTFENAKSIWNKRKSRMDCRNIGFMLTNWGGESEVLERFEHLRHKYKVAFTDRPFPQLKSVFYLKGYSVASGRNIYATQNYLTGKRYIDQFDYVSFINELRYDKQD